MGSIFSKLTQPGPIQGRDLALASAATAQPGTSSVDGTIGQPQISQIPMANAGDVVPGSDQTTNKLIAPPETAPPQITRPTWQQAQTSGNPAELTKGGKLLSLLQSGLEGADRKSTRLNSSHLGISYAVFCL